MEILVIDFDRAFANFLGQGLEGLGCHVEIVSSPIPALVLLRERNFDSILVDSCTPVTAARAILRQIYTRTPTKVRVMTNISRPTMLLESRYEEGIEFALPTAESVLSVARHTGDNEVAIIVGPSIPADLRQTLLEEGYPAAITNDVDSAVRLLFNGTYPLIFLKAEIPGLTTMDEFAVMHTLTTKSLAVLADALPAVNLRSISKPHKLPEIVTLLADLQEDFKGTEHAKPAAL